MQDRQIRFTVPAAYALGSTIITLWLVAGLDRSPFDWFTFLKDTSSKTTNLGPLLSLLVAIAITNFGLGYVCHSLFTLYMFMRKSERFVDFNRLLKTFKLTPKKECKLSNQKQALLERMLLAEFHARLHSHAPSTLIDWCTRRNTAWYVAKTCSIALWIGLFFAIFIIIYNWNPFCEGIFQWRYIIGFPFSFFIVIISSIILWKQGNRWNQEFWDVMWKWIEWDINMHRLPDEWVSSIYDIYIGKRLEA